MPHTLCAPESHDEYRLVVTADADANVLLRLLEPFVIHDVLPQSLGAERVGGVLELTVLFCAPADLASRLKMRLAVMPMVHATRLDALETPTSAAA